MTVAPDRLVRSVDCYGVMGLRTETDAIVVESLPQSRYIGLGINWLSRET